MSSWRDLPRGKGYLRIGHRGAGDLEPQNTLRAFRRALDLGIGAIELDVRWTSDRRLVVIHDDELAESTNGHGRVSELTLSHLLTLDAGQGERIPTLDEALDFLKDKALLVVDLKIAGYEEQVVGCLAEHGVLDSALVCSLIPGSLRRVRSLAPEAFIAISYPEDTGGASTKPYLKHVVSAALMVMRATLPWRIGRMMRYAQADGAMLYHKLLTPALVAAVHRQGGWLGTWTVDRPEDIARAHTLGVDSITSNRPDLL